MILSRNWLADYVHLDAYPVHTALRFYARAGRALLSLGIKIPRGQRLILQLDFIFLAA